MQLAFKFTYGQLIRYDNGVISGPGMVVGIAANDLPVVGVSWIVEDLSGQFPNDSYPYKSFVVMDCHLEG